MNNDISTTSLPVSTSQKLFDAYADWSSIPFIALPLAIFVWSFNKSQSYYQDNENFHNTIQDVIDTQTFGKIIVPLFRHINTSLTRDLISKNRLPTVTEAQAIIEESDTTKEGLLRNYDFSSLAEAIELQDSIEKIIKSKKDQTAFKKAIKTSRTFLIATTIASAINLILGFVLVGGQAVLGFNNPLCITIFVLWAICFGLSIIFILFFYYFKVKIEQMRYE